MNKNKQKIAAVVIAIATALSWSPVFAQLRVLRPSEGGTGISTAVLGDVGNCVKVLANSPFLYTLGSCGSGGGGSGGGTWSTTTSSVPGTLVNYPNNKSDVVVIGATATTSAPFYYDPNTITAVMNGLITTNRITATGTIASIVPYASTTAVTSSGSAYFATTAGNVGISTTTPAANLVVNGTTGQSLFQIATSTNQNIVTVNANGWMGINNATPLAPLDVQAILSTSPVGIIIRRNAGQSLQLNEYDGGHHRIEGVSSSGAPKPLIIANSVNGAAATAGLSDIEMTIGQFGGTALSVLKLQAATGNAGFGTTSPSWKLAVVGPGSFDDYARASYFVATSTATSTYAGGIDAARVCLTGTTTCLAAGGSGSGTVSAGVAGELAFYNTSGTTVTGSSSEQVTVGRFNATSTVASVFPYASTTAITSGGTAFLNAAAIGAYAAAGQTLPPANGLIVSGKFGVGTTTPQTLVQIAGGNLTLDRGRTLDWTNSNGGDAGSVLQLFTDNNVYLDNPVVGGVEIFRTNGSSEKMRLDTAGNLMIGTTTPFGMLTLYKTGSSAANSPQLTFAASTTVTGLASSNEFWTMGTNLADGNKFQIASSTVVGTNVRLTIDGSGNVGISTTSPIYKLSVAGNALFNGAIVNSSTASSTFYGGIDAAEICITGTVKCLKNLAALGTVTSIATNNGLTGGTITTSGTIGFDLTALPVNNLLLTYNGSRLTATGTTNLTAGYFTATNTIASILPYASTTYASISSLTSTRVPYATTGGGLIDNAGLVFTTATANLAATYASTTAFTSSLSAYLATTGGFVVVGTTTPNNLAVMTVASNTPYIDIEKLNAASGSKHIFLSNQDGTFNVSTSSDIFSATSSVNYFSVNQAGHVFASTSVPTVSSGVVDGTDYYGRVTGCSSACTVTFAAPYSRTPSCMVQAETGSITNTLSITPTTASLVVTETSLGTFDYICHGP